MATLDSDSPDEKRIKNIKEDVLGGVVIDLMEPGYKLAKGLFANRQVVVLLVFNVLFHSLWVKHLKLRNGLIATDPPTYLTPEEEVVANVIKREDL